MLAAWNASQLISYMFTNVVMSKWTGPCHLIHLDLIPSIPWTLIVVRVGVASKIPINGISRINTLLVKGDWGDVTLYGPHIYSYTGDLCH